MLLPQFILTFSSNSQQDALFHCITYDYSCADWEGLLDHLRNIPWEGSLKLVSDIFYQIFIFSPNDSPCKTMKNNFSFI